MRVDFMLDGTGRAGSGKYEWQALVGALLGLAVILWIRRYPGIQHDSILYLAQGLQRRWPEIYGEDLFFVHGGQDRYTVLPWILGALFEWIDPPAVFKWGTFSGLLIFVAATWFALTALLPRGSRLFPWLAVVCLPSMYGVVHIFSYAEQFLTPRIFAEAICLLSMVALLKRRWLLFAGLLFAAGAMHPLQTLGALLVIWPWLVLQDRRWLNALWLGLAVLAMAFGGIEPFSGLIQRADPEWLESMQDSAHLFASRWGSVDYIFLAFDVFILLLGAKKVSGGFKQWCWAGLIGLALGIGSSLLLVDMLQLVLPAGLQLWRVHWMVHWIAIVTLALLLRQHWISNDWPRAMLLFLVALLAWTGGGWSWALVAMLYLAFPHIVAAPRERLKTILGAVFIAVVLSLFAAHLVDELRSFRSAGYLLDRYALDRRLLAFPAVALGLPLLCIWFWTRFEGVLLRSLGTAFLVVLVVLGFGAWDSRSLVYREFEGATFNEDVFGQSLPLKSQIYWGGDSPVGPWLILRRASYFSSSQLAGQVFSRGTAMDGKNRRERVEELEAGIRQCLDTRLTDEQRSSCYISERVVYKACSQHPLPKIDFLVLPVEQPQALLGQWDIRDPDSGKIAVSYYLYECPTFSSASMTDGG